MTDTPTNVVALAVPPTVSDDIPPLPGTPVTDLFPLAGPQNPVHIALAMVRGAVHEYTLQAQQAGDGSLVAASEILSAVCEELAQAIPDQPLRHALLLAFEASHPKPMTFIDIRQATEALQHIANARKAVEKRGPGLVDVRGERL